MLDILVKGGPVLWLIMVLAVPVLAVVVERLLYFRRIHTDEDKLLSRVKSAIEKGHHEEALAICDTNEAPLGALIRSGIESRNLPEAELREVVREAALRELGRIEAGIAAVGTIGNIAPLLGLLGTVSGIINSFNVLGDFGAASDPSVLAKGIAEALITTAAGIVLAVPSMVAYSTLSGMANKIIGALEGQAGDLVRILKRRG
ncbi:MAG: MotA/TolQ/ExbB proton channel family protein [Spirochaetales bacterium]